MSNSSKPKPAFYIAVLVVIAALVGFALFQCGKKDEPAKTGTTTNPIDLDKIKAQGGTGQAEQPSDQGVTTVQDYTFEPATKLPAVPGTSDYKAIGKKRVVRFAINVWAGWAPIIYANGGKAAGKIWKDAKGGEFQVELVLIDNPVNMGDTFAAGDVHIGWATVDMLPLVVQRLNRDLRTMPRVYMQVDWSNGGDGIVVRDGVKSVADLRGKKIVLAQNSPSHFFLLNVLLNGGVQPSEVKLEFTQDAFQAAAAFNANKDYAAVVTWAPDIYNLEKVKGNKILVSTATANKLIADVWFARADFARDNPDIVEGLVRGILDATTALKTDDKKQEAAKLMSDVFGLPPADTFGMLADAHWTNYAENRDFFLNQNNPTNFERTYNTAFLLYKAVRAVEDKVPFDQIMDFSVIKKLGTEEKYSSQKNEYEYKFTPVAADAIQQSVESRDPDQDGRDPLLPQLVRPVQEGQEAGRGRQGDRRGLRPERRLHRRGDREAVGAVRRGAHRHRGAHRRVDARHRRRAPGQGPVAQPRQRREGGAGEEVQPRPQPVLGRGLGLGSSG